MATDSKTPTNPNYVAPSDYGVSQSSNFNPWTTFNSVAASRQGWSTGQSTYYNNPNEAGGVYTFTDSPESWNLFWGEDFGNALAGLRQQAPAFRSDLFTYRNAITERIRSGWDLVNRNSLDVASNPELTQNPPEVVPFAQGVNASGDSASRLDSSGWVWVRYRNQPTQAQVDAEAEDAGGTSTEEDYAAISEAMRGEIDWTLERNQQLIPQLMQTALRTSIRTSGQIDTTTQQRLADLGITPGEVLGGMTMAMNLAQEYMSGQVPQDVQDQMARSLAERGIQTNTYGSPLADLSYARNLGLTSMALQQYGMAQYPQLGQQYMSLGQQFIPGTMNLSAIYGNTLNTLAPLMAIPLGGVGQTAASQMGGLVGQSNSFADAYRTLLAEQAYGSYWSGQNLAQGAYYRGVATREAARIADANRRSQNWNNVLGAGSQLGSAWLGNRSGPQQQQRQPGYYGQPTYGYGASPYMNDPYGNTYTYGWDAGTPNYYDYPDTSPSYYEPSYGDGEDREYA